jgi:non-canonical (house-cleaning) NTP pyrophosphatase
MVFGQENSKQKHGAVGSLTKNRINRTQLYVQAVQLALVPFINPGLF